MGNEKMLKKVLIVDDDPDFLDQMEIMMQKDFDLIRATNQKEAEKLLETVTVDAAVLDLMMESADAGFALAYHIKKKNPATPVIIITSVMSETGMDFEAKTPEEHSWIKADAILSKPIRYEQLKHEIQRLMEEKNA
jgi:CheY-like chemotaxis protein